LSDAALETRTPANSARLVVESFERAAERCPDLTPLIYERLFRTHPETRAMFRAESRNLVKGSMLQMAIEALLDFVGERGTSFRMIACEVQSHDAYGTPPELFRSFFAVIVATLRELLADDWSPAIDAAWRETLDELDRYIDEAPGGGRGPS
jgi:hemoglobin-like flavoprotein